MWKEMCWSCKKKKKKPKNQQPQHFKQAQAATFIVRVLGKKKKQNRVSGRERKSRDRPTSIAYDMYY